MQQNTNNTSGVNPTVPSWFATYGTLILSFLALVLVAIAWLAHDIDQTAAIGTIGAILGANGLVSATQWQAAPGLIGQMQTIIAQLATHIQVLHSQQTTAKLPAIQPVAAPLAQTPQQAFPVNTNSFSAAPQQSASAQQPTNWMPSILPSRPNTGG